MYKQIARRPHSFRQEITQFGYPFYFFTLSKSYEFPYPPKGNCETSFPPSPIDFSFRLLFHPWTKTDDSKTKLKFVFFLEKHLYPHWESAKARSLCVHFIYLLDYWSIRERKLKFQFFDANPTFFFPPETSIHLEVQKLFPSVSNWFFFKIICSSVNENWSFKITRKMNLFPAKRSAKALRDPIDFSMDFCHPGTKIKVLICFWELPKFFLKTFIRWIGRMDGWMGGRDIFCPFNFLYRYSRI